MIVVRSPLRVSLFGGGTDRPLYREAFGSTIISFAIDKFIYLIHNPRPTGGCRLGYSEVEELSTLTKAKHSLVRATAEQYGVDEPCTLTIVSDVPKGTGLGSSSALAVALCKLTGACEKSELNIATTAYDLERSVHPEVGAQDHLPAAFGGFNIYRLKPSGDDSIRQIPIGLDAVRMIEACGLLLYTGKTRDSGEILKNWVDEDTLHAIKALADVEASIHLHWTAQHLGEALHKTWMLKSRIKGVCTLEMFDQYERARKAGAWGGKLLGAGGGGCWFFMVEPYKRARVVEALGLTEIPFKVSMEGIQTWLI